MTSSDLGVPNPCPRSPRTNASSPHSGETDRPCRTHTIDIDSFVPRSEIDHRFFDTPYYITPNDAVGQDAFAVIREAMRSKALVALGRIVLAKRERVMALEPYERGLLGTTLHYPQTTRSLCTSLSSISEHWNLIFAIGATRAIGFARVRR